jgi:hypothetical protein
MTFIGLLLWVTRLDVLLKAPGGCVRRAHPLGIVVAKFDVVVHQRCHAAQVVVEWSTLGVTEHRRGDVSSSAYTPR